MQMKQHIRLTLLLLLGMFFSGCKEAEKEQSKEAKTAAIHYQVKEEPMHEALHFAGVVQPLHESSLTSPLDAVVQSMHFHYGQMLKKDDVILTLNSTELQKQYNDTLTEYLKAKDSYAIAKAKFMGTQELWDAGLISKNNYLNEKSGLDTAHVTLMQEARKLDEILDKADEHNAKKLSALNLSDFEEIKKVLTSSHHLIHLKAPNDGVMLYPPRSGGDAKTAKIEVGTSVKAGQVIALIGDLKGISVEIDVPETDIDKITPGMKAMITGVAFGKHQLQGKVVSVNAEASNTNNGLPSFTAIIDVENLSAEDKPWIKVGMSASIEISVDRAKQLLIPIAAVSREKGQSIVHVLSAKGALEKRSVTTGTADQDRVVIETGLKVGDVVVYG
jgi:HlyD family secretion protein